MPPQKVTFNFPTPGVLRIKLNGDWQMASGLPAAGEVSSQLVSHREIRQITFDVSEIDRWDSGLVSFLLRIIRECEHKDIHVSLEELPQGAQKLLALALKVNERAAPAPRARESIFEKVGGKVIQINQGIHSLLDFLGEIAVSLGRLITGKAYFRGDDFMYITQKCGASAFGLVSLISLLVGMILAFVGAIQLKLLGAQIYIADIVGIAMVRMMGAVMTGILMSGRTGASFAAELGIMQANEEIDALKTLGVSPVEFLVIPRVLALVIMMPLLTLYADLMGVLGGFVISVGMLGLNPVEYFNHTQDAVKLSYLWIGLIHSFVFGIIVAIVGCFRGIKCERNAAAVGEATTSAVVTAITAIVIATAIITFICQILGV